MINQVDNVNWLKSLKADISSVSLRKSDWRNYGLFVGLYAENGATLSVGIWWRENKNKLVEWKARVDTVGVKSADLKNKFLF